MSDRDPTLTLQQILSHAKEALALARGKSRASLDDDRLLQLALVRLLEIIGEGASRVPDSLRAQCPQIPWKEIVSARNRLIHSYDSVDYDIVWQVVATDLPPLVAELEQLLSRS